MKFSIWTNLGAIIIPMMTQNTDRWRALCCWCWHSSGRAGYAIIVDCIRKCSIGWCCSGIFSSQHPHHVTPQMTRASNTRRWWRSEIVIEFINFIRHNFRFSHTRFLCNRLSFDLMWFHLLVWLIFNFNGTLTSNRKSSNWPQNYREIFVIIISEAMTNCSDMPKSRKFFNFTLPPSLIE